MGNIGDAELAGSVNREDGIDAHGVGELTLSQEIVEPFGSRIHRIH